MDHRPDLPPDALPEPRPDHLANDQPHEACAGFLAVLSLSLFGIFAVTAVASALHLQLQLLQPDWQLRLSTSLIENGPIVALALVAAWLAVVTEPCARTLREPADHRASVGHRRRTRLSVAYSPVEQRCLAGPVPGPQRRTSGAPPGRGPVGRPARGGALRPLRHGPGAAMARPQRHAPQPGRSNPAPATAPGPAPEPAAATRQPRRGEPQQRRPPGSDLGRGAEHPAALFLALGFAAAAKGRHSAFTLLQVWQDSWFGDPQRLQRLRSRHAGRGRRGPDSPEVEDYFNAISPKD